jgi:hypothetical protein
MFNKIQKKILIYVVWFVTFLALQQWICMCSNGYIAAINGCQGHLGMQNCKENILKISVLHIGVHLSTLV